jgi:D-hydroxyproline dehydrogenase subunit beta
MASQNDCVSLLWDDLRAELPPNVEFDPCGTICVAVDDEEMAEVQRQCAYYQARGVRAEVLDSSALHRAEPTLKTAMAGGLLVEGDSVLYPLWLQRFFWNALRRSARPFTLAKPSSALRMELRD